MRDNLSLFGAILLLLTTVYLVGFYVGYRTGYDNCFTYLKQKLKEFKENKE